MTWSTAVITNTDLFRDIQATFLSTYRDVVGRNPKLSNVMRLGVASDQRVERYGYMESPPTIERWDRGESITEDAFRVISYSVENLNWGKAISFHEDDLEDLKLGDLRDVARQLATRAAQLPERVFFQILTGGTDAQLLKTVPTAPDGAALFATTAGGANRFGVANGNLLTGTGVATAQAVKDDFWSAVEQFRLFQDTEGEPLLDDGVIDRGITICYNVANDEVFREAFMQGRTVEYRAGTSTTDTSTSVGVSNTILESGLKITLWPTQRLTDNDWFVGLDAVQPKAIFEQIRQAPRVIDENRENSEKARRYRIFSTLLDLRAGYGVNLPYAMIQLNN